MSRCIVSAGVFALLLMGGCGSTSQSGVQAEVTPTASTSGDVMRAAAQDSARDVPATQPSQEAEPISSPQALAWTTSVYAQAMEEQLSKRSKTVKAAEPAAETAASQPAAVERVEPAKTQPTEAPVAEDAPATKPAEVILPRVAPTTAPVAAKAEPAVAKTPTESEVKESPTGQQDTRRVDSGDGAKSKPATEEGRESQPAKAEHKPAEVTTDQFEMKLAKQVKDYPHDLVGQLEYQVLQWVRGRQVPQMDVIAQLPAEDQEILSTLLDALSNFRSNVRGNDNMLLGQKARPFVEMADRLRPQASLRIPTVALCQRVQGYGVYDPIELDKFVAGRAARVIVYCEVENFASLLNGQKMWETNLAQETVLYNDRGQRVWVEKRQAFKDLARNRRRDFCVAREMRLPANLKPGQYSLTVSVADQQANRMAEATIPIQVNPPEVKATQPALLEALQGKLSGGAAQ